MPESRADEVGSAEARAREDRQVDLDFRQILDRLPFDVVVLDGENRFLYANRSAVPEDQVREWLRGHTEAEYGSRRNLPAEVVERRLALYARVRATGKPVTFEEARPRFDGSGVRWTLKRLFPMPGAAGEAGQILGCALDVSDRVQAERTLREREARYRTVLDSLLDLVLIVDDDGVIHFATPSSRELLGRKPQELQRTALSDLVHPEDQEALRTLLAGGEAEPGAAPSTEADAAEDDRAEIRFHRIDGRPARLDERPTEPSWRVFEAQAADLRHDPQVGGIFVVARDITARRQAEHAARASEEALRQSQKMEAVGRLAGGLAHDFNNLLTAIQGYCDLLREDVADGPGATYLREITAASERAAEVTRKLLTLSRRQIVHRRVVAINDLVHELESLLRRLIGEDVELVTDLADDAGQVRVDAGQLDQALLNLAVNARDAMPRGGRLVLATRPVELDEADVERRPDLEPGRYVLLSVRDTGIGMDAETLEHIFEPFFTTKESGKGTGLGLATVYATVRQDGGHIEVESEPGQGALFRLFLPSVDAEPDDTQTNDQGRRAARGTETVLLVEDEGLVRKLVRTQLETLGYEVFDADGGEAALELAEEIDVDLLVSDVVMPGMSGPELARLLVDRRPGLPVLFLSGYTGAFLGQHGFSDEEHEVLPKPFSQKDLARRVRALLDRAR